MSFTTDFKHTLSRWVGGGVFHYTCILDSGGTPMGTWSEHLKYTPRVHYYGP